MKISSVTPYVAWIGFRNQLLVKVEADNGQYGWGESGLSGRELAVEGAIKHYREFLVGKEAQKIYASVGHEYPVRQGITRGSIVAGMGDFKMDDLQLEILGRNNAEAVRVFDRVGWR